MTRKSRMMRKSRNEGLKVVVVPCHRHEEMGRKKKKTNPFFTER